MAVPVGQGRPVRPRALPHHLASGVEVALGRLGIRVAQHVAHGHGVEDAREVLAVGQSRQQEQQRPGNARSLSTESNGHGVAAISGLES